MIRSPYKTKAIKLRRKGLSYNEIRKEVPVAKSTLSLWLKSIPLKEGDRQRLYTKSISILNLGPKSQKERRAREIAQIISVAEEEINFPLSFDSYRLMGAALYWAEGTKGSGLELTNSDPHLILFFVRWIEKIFNISAKNLKARLNIYPQQNEDNIKNFWSDLTGVPVSNFGKSYIKPISTGYKKNNLYYGTIRIEVPKGTDMRHKIFGWVQSVMKDIIPRIKSVERKWIKLTEVARPINMPQHPPIA